MDENQILHILDTMINYMKDYKEAWQLYFIANMALTDNYLWTPDEILKPDNNIIKAWKIQNSHICIPNTTCDPFTLYMSHMEKLLSTVNPEIYDLYVKILENTL